MKEGRAHTKRDKVLAYLFLSGVVLAIGFVANGFTIYGDISECYYYSNAATDCP